MYAIYGNSISLVRAEPNDSLPITDKPHKTAFSTLKIKLPKNYKEFTFEDKKIQVAQYLPIAEKIDIIEIAYQRALINSKFDPLFFNVYFWLNIVYSYTNLTFTDEQKKNEDKLYDMLASSGLLSMILAAMDEKELEYFSQSLDYYISTKNRIDNSVGGIVSNLTGAMNKFSGVISEKFSNLDEATIQKIIDAFPQLVNGDNKIIQSK